NTYMRHNAEVRAYYPIIENVVFRVRGAFGLVTSRLPQGVPVYERYFLGGIFNVRGFPLNSLGPRIGLAASPDAHALVSRLGVGIGGNAQFYYNIEIEFPILQEVGIRGVVFTDGGNAWNLFAPYCQLPPAGGGGSSNDACTFNPFDINT